MKKELREEFWKSLEDSPFLMIRRDNVAVQDFYAGLGFAPSDVVVMQKVIEPG